jgi:hypothetical protein
MFLRLTTYCSPQEKPAPLPPAPAPTSTSQDSIPAPTTAEPEGWEEPTTGQAPPTWDEEPQKVASEAWSGSDAAADGDAAGRGDDDGEAEAVAPSSTTKEEIQLNEPEPEAPAQPQQEQPVKQTRPVAVSNRTSAASRYRNVDSPVVMPNTIFGAAAKSIGAGGAVGFGGVGAGAGGVGMGAPGGLGVEKVGMQFGSLSLGGDSFDSNA